MQARLEYVTVDRKFMSLKATSIESWLSNED